MTVSDKEVLTEFIQARITRASEHLDELRRDVATLQETDRARVVTDLSPDKRQVAINIVYRVPHPNRRWATLVGDFAHNLRSTLNNTIYAIGLTRATTFPPKDDWLLSFPIADETSDWKRTKRAIRSMPPEVQTIVESTQPCHGGNPILSLLGSINNQDKHMLAVPGAGGLVRSGISFYNPPDGTLLNFKALNGPAIDDTPLVILTFSEPQTSKPDVKIELSSAIFLAHAGAWHEAFKLLEEMRAEVQSITNELTPFITEGHLGTPPRMYLP